MPGNRIAVLRNVHITPNVRDVHERRIASDATVHNTWRLPKEQGIAQDTEFEKPDFRGGFQFEMAEDGGSARKTRKLDRSARAVARLSQGVNDVSNKTRYECL